MNTGGDKLREFFSCRNERTFKNFSMLFRENLDRKTGKAFRNWG